MNDTEVRVPEGLAKWDALCREYGAKDAAGELTKADEDKLYAAIEAAWFEAPLRDRALMNVRELRAVGKEIHARLRARHEDKS